ncbi:MAG TPA: GNAT family N-acetyltransferase, partial [Actinomycetota bacterium]|nr:GNAT family N-acetyltransferase [Actinomycetota bacterium]
MPPADVRTERLRLIPCDAALLAAVMRDEPLPGLRRHFEWPGDDLRGAIPIMLARLTERAETAGWGPWLIVLDGEVIGDAGTHGPPDETGEAEIGFAVVPALRRRGIASEAVEALLG